MAIMNTIYKKKEGIIVTPLDDSFLIFPSHTDETNRPYLCKLNKTSYFIFECIDGIRSIEDIVDILSHKYTASKDEIKSDVLELLTHLENRKIIIK